MAFTIISHAAAGSVDSNSATTGAIDTSGASLFAVFVSGYNSVDGALPSDSRVGNDWVPVSPHDGGSTKSRFFYVVNPVCGIGHTFTVTQAGSYPSLCVVAVSGSLALSPFDQENGATGVADTQATGSITPTQDGELIVTGVTFDPSGTTSIDAGFTILDQINQSGGQHFGSALAYKIQAVASAVNPTWSVPGVTSLAVGIASFKVAVGASGMSRNTTSLLLLIGN